MNFEKLSGLELDKAKNLEQSLRDYLKVFDLTEDDIRNKRILEIGAFDRKFATACIQNNITNHVYSLEPALSRTSGRHFVVKKILNQHRKNLPREINRIADKRAVAAIAEAVPFIDQSFDLALGKCVPHETIKELKQRLKELLRVAKEIRIFPIMEHKRMDYESVVRQLLRQGYSFDFSFKTTQEENIGRGKNRQRIKDDVLIIRTPK